MKILELFSGTESFSKVARKRRHQCITLDNDNYHNPTICKSIMDFNIKDLPKGWKPDIIWASPPCTTFSIASVSTHWDNHIPKSIQCKIAMKLLSKMIELIILLKPKYFFIENPMGMLRKIPPFDVLNRNKITYCQYGDERMKPTDIWHNCLEWKPRQACKNGMHCHISAPRGSRTGTQGLRNSIERSKIPEELCLEIIKVCEENETNKKL